MMTKQEEREALERIRIELDQLEPGGYVASAFDGCAMMAEQNIDNDWCLSPTQRIEQLEAERDALTAAVSDKSDRIAQLEAAAEKRLNGQDLSKAAYYLMERRKAVERLQASAAAQIVQYAEDPSGEDFVQAVNTHRNATAEAADLAAIIEKLRAAI